MRNEPVWDPKKTYAPGKVRFEVYVPEDENDPEVSDAITTNSFEAAVGLATLLAIEANFVFVDVIDPGASSSQRFVIKANTYEIDNPDLSPSPFYRKRGKRK